MVQAIINHVTCNCRKTREQDLERFKLFTNAGDRYFLLFKQFVIAPTKIKIFSHVHYAVPKCFQFGLALLSARE